MAQAKTPLPIPATFDPSNKNDDARSFIERFELYSKINNWSSLQSAQTLGLFLGNVALNWFLTLSPETKNDYESVKKSFLATFSNGDSKVNKITLMNRQKQTNETLEEYLSDIFKLFSLTNKVDEKDKIFYFIRGLPINTKFFVLGKNPESLVEAINLAKLHNNMESEMSSAKQTDIQKIEPLNMISQPKTQNSDTENFMNAFLFQMSDILGRLESDLNECKEGMKCIQRNNEEMFSQGNDWNGEFGYCDEEAQ